MSDNDLIRRGDAKRFAHQAIILRGKHANVAAVVDHTLAALPAADPLADPRVQALAEALKHMVNHAILDEQDEGVFWEAVPLARKALAAFKGDEA
jgi:hypothetical protein